MNAEGKHAQAVPEIMFPDGLVPFLEILSAPHVVDDDVETTLLGANTLDQLLDFISDEMVHPNGDSNAAGRRDQLGCLLPRPLRSPGARSSW